MAYYLQQGGLYLDMTNHPKDRKPNERKRLHRRPDGTYYCRGYSAWEPEQPSGKKANRIHWNYASTTPQWAIDSNTELTGERAISNPAWMYTTETGTVSNTTTGTNSIDLCGQSSTIDLEVLTVQRESQTDPQRELKMFSAFDHVLKIGIASPVREIRPCTSESEAQRDFRIANTAGSIYHNLSTGILQSDCNALTKSYAQMRVAWANNSVAMMSVSSSDNDLHNMWQVYNAAAWRSSVHESCRDIRHQHDKDSM